MPKSWTPHKYQKKAIKFMLENSCGIQSLSPGLGKSSVSLATIKILKAKGLVSKVLLIAPLRVCYSVWPREIEKWTDFNDLSYVILHGPKKDKLLQEEKDIYIINPEGIGWLVGAEKSRTNTGKTRATVDRRKFKTLGFDMLLIDEIVGFKHPSSLRFKILKQVHDLFSRRWGLTGTIVPNGLMDLFGQMYIVDQGRSLGPYITHFRNKYFTPSYNGFDWDLRAGADVEIYGRVSPMILQMTADDYLDMPKLIENNIYVDLPPDAMTVYKAVEDDLIARIEDKTIIANNAAVASMKTRQVASGGAYTTPDIEELVRPKAKKEWIQIHTEKVEALRELIAELQGSPLFVAYNFVPEMELIRSILGENIPYLGGGVSEKKFKDIEERWNAGKIPVLLGQPQSAALGLNLQAAGNNICWYSLTWDLYHYEQFIDRVWRQGNENKQVFNHHILARGTIDEVILMALKDKDKGQNAVYDALKKLAKERRGK